MSDSRLFLYTSNQIEKLAEMLAGRMVGTRIGEDPFRPETVMVQSGGMARWLSLQLADARGVSMNIDFPFPRELIGELLKTFAPTAEQTDWYERETMTWTLFRYLESAKTSPGFQAIAHYLEEGDPLKRLQLAERVAHLFDQYLVYRPDLLIEWEEGETGDWQAVLWRKLVSEAPEKMHLARVTQEIVLNGITLSPDARESLPGRIFVFGISSLPPLFLEVLQAYGKFGEVHLFLLQPTELYWGDLKSKREQLLQRGEEETDPLEEGHPLVASLGRQGRDLLNLLIDYGFQHAPDGESFCDPGTATLLRNLQSDIGDLIQRESEDRIRVTEEDRSIEIHSCHSPMREVEVLHDQLLDRFEKDPTLRPRDVLVMIPNIELYAPYIEAVFGSSEERRTRIPFSLVDRRPRTEYHAIDVWFRLLELAEGRFGTRDLISLLETAPLRERLKLSERETATLRDWVAACGIRWGVDAGHRKEEGMPAFSEGSWKNGIEQWLLGFAMRGRGGEAISWEKVFPFDEVEGGNADLLNSYLEALDLLFRARTMLKEKRSPAGWRTVLADLLELVFGGLEPIAHETEKIRSALESLETQTELAQVDEELPLEVIRYLLERQIDDSVSSGKFLSGGVTFCTLQPMRMIPARLICLLGMDDTAFPRRPQQLGFDRMREFRRLGDRSVREDDRYLFLETLLSARDQLLISYCGQSSHDLADLPPSVLVSELLDHLDQSCVFPGGVAAAKALVIRHRLQPFHPEYFSGRRLFSYSQANAESSRKLFGEEEAEPDFFAARLPEPEESFRTVEIGQLVRFFQDPTRFLIQERLGLRLPEEEAVVDDSEPFALDGLSSYKLKADAVRGMLEQEEEIQWERAQTLGRAPLGSVGLAGCHEIENQAAKFAERIWEIMGNAESENRPVSRKFDDFVLQGEIGPVFAGNRLILFRPASLKGKDLLVARIQHLIGCLEEEDWETFLIAEDQELSFSPVADAETRLRELLELYWEGLRRPLPFFPETSFAFCTALEGKRPESAMNKAIQEFEGGYQKRAEREKNPYMQLCWGKQATEEILNEEFQAIALGVFSGVAAAEKGERS